MDATRLKEWLVKAGRGLPWSDLGVAAAVVVVGISQIFFSLLRENADYFPTEPWFHLGVVVWAVLVPVAALLALDLAMRRWAGRGKGWGFAAWRAALYTFLFASLFRQTQVYYPSPFQWVVERIPPRPLYYALLVLVALLCLRSKVLVHRFVATFGLLAALLTCSYVYRAGLLGEAWRESRISVPGSAAAWNGDPTLICVFDELSSDMLMKGDRVDAESFPNFAALAADSAWFPKAQTNFMFTKDAFPSMLTGRLFPGREAPTLFDHLPRDCHVVARDYFPSTYGWMRRNARGRQTFLLLGKEDETLQEFFGIPRALYELFEQTPFSRSPFAVNPGRRILPPLIRLAPGERSPPAEIASFLSSVGSSAGKLIMWHCEVPHFPFRYNADGSLHGDEANSELLGPQSMTARETIPPGYSVERTLLNYKKQIGFADLILGQLVATLKREGLYERTTLIVTSDHGLRTWGALPTDGPDTLWGGLLRIPLMIRGPRVKNGVYDVDYFHVDFTPTMLDALGIPFDATSFEGVSAFAPARPARAPVMYNHVLKKFEYDASTDTLRRCKPR